MIFLTWINLTLDDKHLVNDCKVAYNKLHPTLRNQVTNYEPSSSIYGSDAGIEKEILIMETK